MTGVRAAVLGALAIAAVSTAGDFIWATWIPRHRPQYGLAHGTLLLGCIGFLLGLFAGRPLRGALGGGLIGLAAAGSFYLLAPLAGFSVMFAIWFALWIGLAAFDRHVLAGPSGVAGTLARGLGAAVLSGAAFYAISGIWMPFRPRGWDYAVHFASWTGAYLPGFVMLKGFRGSAGSVGSRGSGVQGVQDGR